MYVFASSVVCRNSDHVLLGSPFSLQDGTSMAAGNALAERNCTFRRISDEGGTVLSEGDLLVTDGNVSIELITGGCLNYTCSELIDGNVSIIHAVN